MRVLIQLRPAPEVVASVIDPGVRSAVSDVVAELPGVLLDRAFTPVAVPRPVSAHGAPLSPHQRAQFSMAPEDASVLVRGEISDAELTTRSSLLSSSVREVAGVFADPTIQSHPTCGDSGPVGDWEEVRRLLHAYDLWSAGHDGEGVAIAIVDTGINADHVAARIGHDVTIDADRSWSPPGVDKTPGRYPVDHGSMCAFDTLIAAPKATLLDIPVLLSRRPGPTADGLLSDAVAAYSHLRAVLQAMPADSRSLVVSNSWGLFSPDMDFPPGHPGNYSDNPAHPFNLIVGSLEEAGADILFSAGNCGRECPDRRCGFPDRSIAGANSHPRVLSVGGVDTRGERVGYSSQGPGRLSERKPDLCAYTHFAGSEAVGAADTGTSTACPVAAGVVAAVRTHRSAAELSPAQLRTLLHRTADDRSTVGFDHDYGYGVIDPPAILAALGRQNRNRAA
ncbi:subtilisin family serine protease [Nonomuraea thailandensis]|uniref:Subtilisin family serine protease n=1 Tax=Nonomuraea thailandensis TaxID=1188745 RepID=A0A9X2GPQ2_9ACTN|nr:S8 family serine peptidase [Nonomuraea thailandensis]MCP2362931.1 subtilisin family serine protease [Nonomuraea thailandensis]